MKIDGVHTNLPPQEFHEVLRAIRAGEATQVPGSDCLIASSGEARFELKGELFHLTEEFECVMTLHRIPPGATDEQIMALEMGGLVEEVGATPHEFSQME